MTFVRALLIFFSLSSTAGSAGTVALTLGWNTGSGAQSNTYATVPLNNVNGFGSYILTVHLGVGQAFTYATAVAGASGNPQYGFDMRLDRLL